MNQPPGGGYPPGPPFPGHPGFPQHGYAPQPPVGQPSAAKTANGTVVMNQAPYGAPPAYGAQAPMPGYGHPAMPPVAGQPPLPHAQGVSVPQLGVGGVGAYGMPKINVHGGDFSANKLMAAVVSGQGFASPRKMGLIMMGLALAFGIGNFLLVFVAHRYYPYLYSIGAIFGWTGLWLAMTGQPRAREDGSKAPMWSRIGLAAFFGIGVLVGIALCFFNWEGMVVDSAMGH